MTRAGRRLTCCAVGGLLLLGGCGQAPPALPTSTKTVPVLAETYGGRALATWRALSTDVPAEERAAQAWALGVLEKDPLASLDVLLRLLRDPEASVRFAAIVAVGRLAPPSPEVAGELVSALKAPEEPLRRHARVALGHQGRAALSVLRAALGSDNVRVRWAAVWALGEIGLSAAAVVTDVRPLAATDASPLIRRQAGFSLARMGPKGIEACVALLRTAESVRRAELATALSRGGPGVVGPMAALLADPDGDLAARAAGVLADLGPAAAPALDALVLALRRAGPVRFNAADALRQMGPAASDAVKPLVSSPDEGLRAIAQSILDDVPDDPSK